MFIFGESANAYTINYMFIIVKWVITQTKSANASNYLFKYITVLILYNAQIS